MLIENIKPMTEALLGKGVELLPKVNELFELELAYLEYSVLSPSKLLKNTAYFKSVNGIKSRHYCLYSSTAELSQEDKFIEDSGNYSSAYASHGLFPYRGKFHPQMIKALINIAGVQKGDMILDPMAGSGTTNIEAALMGIDSYALDVSPFCQFMINTKYQSLTIDPQLLEYLPGRAEELFAYFSKGDVINRLDSVVENEKRKVYNLAFLAYLDALGYSKRVKMSNHEQLFIKVLNKYHTSIKSFTTNEYYSREDIGNVSILRDCDATNISLPVDSVDCIITSPPYSFAIDYMENDRDQLRFLGYDPDELKTRLIGLKGKNKEDKLFNYFADMKLVCSEAARVLKNGKYFIVIIGSNTNQTGGVRLEHSVIESAKSSGLTLVKSMLKPIRGMRNTMKDEYILFFRKEI